MEPHIKKKAIALSEGGDADELYRLIKPYIEAKDPFASYLYSTFSLREFNESEADFSDRDIRLKKFASENGIAEASYRMGVNHLYGDDVVQDYGEAAKYFERAIEQGHTHTKFTYGYSLYYGTDENAMDKPRGLELMRQAQVEGSEGARNELARIQLET